MCTNERGERYMRYKISDLAKLVEDKVKEVLNNGVVGAYLDLTLLKKVGSLKEVSVTETAAGVVVKLDIPESLKNTDSSVERKYTVVR